MEREMVTGRAGVGLDGCIDSCMNGYLKLGVYSFCGRGERMERMGDGLQFRGS